MQLKQGHGLTAFYLLDGAPVRMGAGHRPERWDGVAVDWSAWMHRAVWISAEEYEARVAALRAAASVAETGREDP